MQRALTLLGALFVAAAIVIAQLLAGQTENAPILLALVVPVAIVAIDFGVFGGLVASLLTVAIVLEWNNQSSVTLSNLDLFARAIIPLAVGLVVGLVAEQAKQAERRRADAAIGAQRVKDEFFDSVSHELRTPLTSIFGYVALLRESAASLEPEQRRAVAAIERNAHRQFTLVRDMLVLVHDDTGRLEVLRRTVDPIKIVNAALKPIGKAAGRVSVSDQRTHPEPLSLDSDLLAQMLHNLLDNAIKFGRGDGAIFLQVRDTDEVLVFAVRNEGSGVPSSEQSQVFSRAFRGSQAVAAATPGTGIGLTAAQVIAEAHGGTIRLESTAAGTEVRVELPLRPEITA